MYIVPDAIEEIEPYEYSNRTDITYLRLPDGLKRIGRGAFCGCDNLLEVYIPKSVEFIDEGAFEHFRLIYCEHAERPEGWYFKLEELPIDNAGADEDILNSTSFHNRITAWCGSDEYEYTFDEFIAEGRDYYDDPERRVIWGRSWEHFYVNEETGEWRFRQLSYLASLGYDILKRGHIPYINPVAGSIREEIYTKLENRYETQDIIVNSIKKYVDVIVDIFTIPEHIFENVFETWILYYYIRRAVSMDCMPELRKVWLRPLTIEMKKWSDMLEEIGGGTWILIRDILEETSDRSFTLHAVEPLEPLDYPNNCEE